MFGQSLIRHVFDISFTCAVKPFSCIKWPRLNDIQRMNSNNRQHKLTHWKCCWSVKMPFFPNVNPWHFTQLWKIKKKNIWICLVFSYPSKNLAWTLVVYWTQLFSRLSKLFSFIYHVNTSVCVVNSKYSVYHAENYLQATGSMNTRLRWWRIKKQMLDKHQAKTK